MSSISSAKRASVGVIALNGTPAPLPHGGDLAAARLLFPNAPEPFLDLSTGINPHSYPIPSFASDVFTRLPEPTALERLAVAAARAYGAPSGAHIVAAPGTQLLLAQVAALVPPGRAMLLGPTYAEHARAAVLAGHTVNEARGLDELADADLAILVNPNNPDGRVVPRAHLLTLAQSRPAHRGLLVIDEAFMDVGPLGESLCAEVERGRVVVLRSFGKFFGLAGVRLGFAITAPAIAARLRAVLGPWAVSGPAIAIGEIALADTAWIAATRARVAEEAGRLDQLLQSRSLAVAGGTSLFRLVRTPRAAALYDQMGRAGVLVRRFEEHPHWLRFGLLPDEPAWQRLTEALSD
jgi:cobalamin biosynthesis protein CobC